ncbi:MAG: hypothetical protein E6Q58_01875, partial [Niabella sp.]
MDSVLNVLLDTTSVTECVYFLPQILQNQVISVAVNGIGTTKFVLLAQRDTHSIQTKSVLQSAINVNLTTLQDNAQLASKATILSMVLVSSHLLTTPSLLMLDAEIGIGTTKFVLLAQRDTHSIQTKSVLQSAINVNLTTLQDNAQLASKATILSMVLVSSH